MAEVCVGHFMHFEDLSPVVVGSTLPKTNNSPETEVSLHNRNLNHQKKIEFRLISFPRETGKKSTRLEKGARAPDNQSPARQSFHVSCEATLREKN